MSSMASDVSDVCQKLQDVQLQLHLILNRNEEVLKNLAEAEKLVAPDGSSIDKDLFRKKIEQSTSISKKLEESIQSQCSFLSQAVKELELRTAEDRLSATEQKSSLELQLKSQLNHNVQLHEEKAELETRLKEHMSTLKESGRQADKLEEELVETKKQIKGLLDLFEGKAQEADRRIDELQTAMGNTQERAQKFQELYEAEKEISQTLELERMRTAVQNTDDDYAFVSRPHTFIKRAKSVPVDPQAIDPLYQSVMEENTKLRIEIERLKGDNVHLVTKNKQAQKDVETIQNHVATCSTQRSELRRRLKKEQDAHRKLSSSLTRQASDWITQKKMARDIDHYTRVGKVQPESTLSASARYRSHPIKANEDKPRNIPVESWSSGNPLRGV